MTPRMPRWAREYDTGKHPSYAYTGDVVAFAPDRVSVALLLIQRGREPFRGLLAVPGGFVDAEGDATAREAALRELEEETQAGPPAWLEALDTYDRAGRDPRQFAGHTVAGRFVPRGNRVVSRAYLALYPTPPEVRPRPGEDARLAAWASVYDVLPWEDLRDREGLGQRREVLRRLRACRRDDPEWPARVRSAFGHRLDEWNEERAGERLRLLLEAGLAQEAWRDRWGRLPTRGRRPEGFGGPLAFDHRIMVADALGRLRGKLKYVPAVLAALVPPRFTLPEFQRVVEAVAGRPLVRPNFRRLVTRALVRPLGERVQSADARGGRPAELYGWREGVERLRLDPSLRLPWSRAAAGGRPEGA